MSLEEMGAMTGLLLLLWAGVTVGSVVDLQKRIIDGKTCDSNEGLYHVELRKSLPAGGYTLCGGSLIAAQWVLTVAHCWDSSRTMTAVVGLHPGDHQEELEVLNHHPFPDHDIMLLKIKTPKKTYPVVQLPDCAKRLIEDVDKVQVAGRGATTTDTTNKKISSRPMTLQCGKMTVVKCGLLDKCKKTKGVMELRDETLLCYKDDKVDTAPGDSGGGVVSNNMIYGVHSTSYPRACVGASIAMDVCDLEYLDWIYKTTSIIRPLKRDAASARL